MIRSTISVVMATALMSATIAKAETAPPCMNETEFRALVSSVVPPLISTLSDRCARLLSPDEFLAAPPTNFLNGINRAAEQEWPSAHKALMRIAKANGAPPTEAMQMDKLLTRDLFAVGLKPMFEGLIKKDMDCLNASRLLGDLALLPPANFVGVVIDVVHLGRKDEGKDDPFPVCKRR